MAKKPPALPETKAKASAPAAGARLDVDKEGRRKPADEQKEAEEVKRWADRIIRAETDHETWFSTDIPRLRKYVTGEMHNDGAPGLVRTNLIWATIATQSPHIYAKDPEIQVALTDAVPKEQYGVYKDFARSLQAILDSVFTKGGKLKLRARSAVRSAMTTAVGWAKVTYQSDVRKDPLISARMNDTQDNIQRVLALMQQIEKGEEDGDKTALAAQKLELQSQMDALTAENEVNTVHGIVIDRVLTEDMLILDDTIKDFDYYVEAEAIAHGVWFTADRFQTVFGYVIPEGATPHDKPQAKPGESSSQLPALPTGTKPESFFRVWEIWHKTSNTVLTLVKGAKTWAREPFQPEHVGERWYPFFGLAFNPVDGRWRPMSDVELLTELQDEYNTTRTNFAEARKSSIPVLIVRAGGELTEEDIKRIRDRKINQIIVVEGTPGNPIANEVAFLPTAPIDPAVYDTTAIRADFEMVSGTADAARGNVTKVKTATEADILQQGLLSRTDDRRNMGEHWAGEMAQYSAEILLECLTRPQVARLVGMEAAERWPQLSRDRVFEMVQLNIKAGSAGRPNEQRDREQWIALLPEIQKTIQQVFELQMQGDTRMARTAIELLKETLERFDEYIDLDRFIPPEMQDGDQDATSKMMQEMAQLKAQLQAMQEELAKAQEEKVKADMQAKAASSGEQAKVLAAQEKADLDRDMAEKAADLKRDELRAKDAESRRESTAESLRHTRELAFQERIEKLKRESAERIEIRKAQITADAADKKAKLDAENAKTQLQSTEKVEGEKLKVQEKMAGEKNKSTERVAGDKNKTTEKTTKMGVDAKTKAGEAEAETATGEGKVMDKLASALDRLADVMGADQVPERGPDGKITRVRKVVKPKAGAKPKSGGKQA